MSYQLTNTDASDSIFIESQLANIIPKAHEAVFPNLKAKELFPVDYSDGDGVDIIKWFSYNARGLAKLLAGYAAKDIPRVDLGGNPNFAQIFSGGSSYAYSIDDVKKAIRNNINLEARKAIIAQRANDELIEKLAFKGDEDFGIKGILNQPNIPKFNALKGANDKILWKDKQPKEILNDLYSMFNTILTSTNELECPDTAAMPPSLYNILSDTPYSDRDSTPLLEVFKRSKPEIKNIFRVPQLAKAGANGSDVIIFYERNEDKICLKIPHETEHLLVQNIAMEFVINTRLRVAGIVVFYPMSILIGEGF